MSEHQRSAHDHPHDGAKLTFEAKVLTVSDSVDAGTRADEGGPAVSALLADAGFLIVERRVCADGPESVALSLSNMAYNFWGLIVTTGGTGFGPRDMTPEGTVRILDRRAYGLSEAMRAAHPNGRLSRIVAGTRGHALIINTPGSPNGAVEMLEAIVDVLPHALSLMAGVETPHPRT
ncbi:MAG: MogA/MoaB family molybdenum cofactor biosynthesis protein [Microthrixaceae bacterium]